MIRDETTTLTVRVSGGLRDFVAAQVAESGHYENVSEYLRHLIRSDQAHAEQQAFKRLKAELALAYAAPDASYELMTAAGIVRRNRG